VVFRVHVSAAGPHPFGAIPVHPPPATILPPLQPTVDSSAQSPVYMLLSPVGRDDQPGDDTSTFSSSIDVGLHHHHPLTRWNNVDNLQMRLGSSASETTTTPCPVPSRTAMDLRDLPRPQPTRPPASPPPRTRRRRATRLGMTGAVLGDDGYQLGGESDIDGQYIARWII